MITAVVLTAVLGCPIKPGADQRAYCYAHQQSSAAQCRAIAETRLRRQCQRELGPEYQHCLKIDDGHGRFLCRRARSTGI